MDSEAQANTILGLGFSEGDFWCWARQLRGSARSITIFPRLAERIWMKSEAGRVTDFLFGVWQKKFGISRFEFGEGQFERKAKRKPLGLAWGFWIRLRPTGYDATCEKTRPKIIRGLAEEILVFSF
jgi:hypothetical protein